MNIYYIISFAAYFLFFMGISFYFYRKQNSDESYVLGDRQVNYWVTAISAQASDMSDWLFMGYPGLIYGVGIFNIWVAIGLVVFMFLNWQLIAPKLRVLTEKYNSLTLASFFESRFQDTIGTLRLLTVFFTSFFIVSYICAELIGLGRLCESVFQINYNVGIGLSIILVVINIIFGGFAALAWSDMIRGLFLLVMIILVPLVAINRIDSWGIVYNNLSLNLFVNKIVPDFSFSTLKSIVLLSMGWGLGYFGSPHILMNFMSIKDPNKISKAKYIGISWQVLVLVAATCVALVGHLFFSKQLPNSELVFIEMVKQLFNPLFAGFILCAVLAATMSVMTAQIFATATMIGQEFKNKLLAMRLSIVLLPVISYLFSYNNTSSVNDLVSYAWSGLGLTFAPLVFASLYGGKYVNKYGAGVGMILGWFIGTIWPYLGFNFMPLLPGFCLLMIVIFMVSYLTNISGDRHEVY